MDGQGCFMSELETMKRAKTYIDKLANGINPIDDTAVSDTDIVNHIRVSRCLFFVSDVLRQVIEAGGVVPTSTPRGPQQKKMPFFIPYEKRDAFEFSESPIPASELAARLNKLANEPNMKRMSYKGITSWLKEAGLLSDYTRSDGHTTKRPTPDGNKLGITLEERMSSQGSYHVVVYDMEAQHFILDNLDAIGEVKNSNFEMQGKPWSQSQDDCLRDLYQKNVPLSEIAMTLKRNTGAIRSRLKKLGLIEH